MSKTQIGDIKGFSIDMLQNIMYLVGLGYLGGSIMSISTDTNSLESIFPTNMNELPYSGKPTLDLHPNIIEYFLPMKSLGFPYTYYDKSDSRNIFIKQYCNWWVLTCMYTFIAIRKLFQKYYVFFSTCTTGCKRTIGFYLFPYILIYSVQYIFPLYAGLLTFLGSNFANDGKTVKHAFVFGSSWLVGWAYPLVSSSPPTIGLMTFPLMIISEIMGVLATMYIHCPLWLLITGCAYLYGFAVLFFSPFLPKGKGLYGVFCEVLHHKVSLSVLFIYLTIMSAKTRLTSSVSLGIAIGGILIALSLIFSKKKKGTP